MHGCRRLHPPVLLILAGRPRRRSQVARCLPVVRQLRTEEESTLLPGPAAIPTPSMCPTRSIW